MGSRIIVFCWLGLFACHQPGPPKSQGVRYLVTDYGAVGDDGQMDTEAIQKAINACAAQGGGTVIFPAGQFNSGSLLWKNGVSIHLSAGAVLKASPAMKDYPLGSFIVAKDIAHVSMDGKGIIDGNGQAFWDDEYKPLERPVPFILLEGLQGVAFRDVAFRNSPSHTLRLENSTHVTFDGISIKSPFEGPNTDGIDIVDSRNVTVANCLVSTGDDAICLKSQHDTVENVVVANCILESDDAAIKFGTGSRVATRFCVFSNTLIRKSRYGVALFMLDGGVFEHNLFTNLTIENGSRHPHQYPVYIDIDKRVADRPYGQVRDLSFSNIKMVTDGKVLVSGHPSQSIANIQFTNITMHVPHVADFSGARKPRGNKNYPKLATSIDLSRQQAHFVHGYTNGLALRDIAITTPATIGWEAVYTTNITGYQPDNITLTNH